jgi:hypothetical protein
LLLLAALPAFPAFGGDAGGYWSRPVKGLPAHGGGPPGAEEFAKFRYYPKDCAACHAAQYEDWSAARHARSVGAGLQAQLDPERPGFAASCYRCHAPLRAQGETVASGDNRDEYVKNPVFDERLKATGVNCAVCHLRDGVIYGPSLPSKGRRKKPGPADPPHASAQKDLLSSAEFCAACHQLDSGYKLNGKPLMNTYAEWSRSEYAASGLPCQGCHMPGRRHLFRGIHDPEMVLGGIEILAEKLPGGGSIKARVKITNSAVGHMFPTYVTPAVEIRGSLTDSTGAKIIKSIKKAVIGRRVELDLSREVFDTRIPPGGSFSFDYETGAGAGARGLVLEVWVFPDEFYNRFFSSLLKGDPDGTKEADLKEALRETESGYLLYKKEFSL